MLKKNNKTCNCIKMKKTPLKKELVSFAPLTSLSDLLSNTSTSLSMLQCFQVHGSVLTSWAFLQTTVKLEQKHLQSRLFMLVSSLQNV